jgi:hypothetical protein
MECHGLRARHWTVFVAGTDVREIRAARRRREEQWNNRVSDCADKSFQLLAAMDESEIARCILFERCVTVVGFVGVCRATQTRRSEGTNSPGAILKALGEQRERTDGRALCSRRNDSLHNFAQNELTDPSI